MPPSVVYKDWQNKHAEAFFFSDVFATLSNQAHWRFIGCGWLHVFAPHMGSVNPALQTRSKSCSNLSIQYTSITALLMLTSPV